MTSRSARRMGLISLSLPCLLLSGIGCRRNPPASVAPPASAAEKPGVPAEKPNPTPQPLTAEQLKEARPNEVGLIPILEYHDIGTKHKRMSRSPEQFRKDLERLYKEGYRPISMSEYLENRIDLPLGKSPVLLTFDDSIESQFRYLPDGSLDPNCALGILEAFHKEHPDFPMKATFFVLPGRLFDQSGLREQKLQELVDKGFDIGNHTVTHRLLRRLPDTEVQKEIASAADRLQKIAPKARIETLALPGGVLPRNQALLKSGQWEGISYTNQATFLAGAEPSPPPASKKFKPMRLPRVLAVEEPMGITYWLNMLRDTPGMRYISDGDPNTITVPKFKADTVEKARLQGKNLRTY